MEPGALAIRHFCARSDHIDTGIKRHYLFAGSAMAASDRNDVFRLPLVTRQLLNCRAPAGRAETTHPAAMMLL